ncbi:hypothetical protein [Nostoc sp.]|uniref:hypothetical protein n=1 Tax=Nostoc sp. TaxID=1180 RepID=UPI002FF5DD00
MSKELKFFAGHGFHVKLTPMATRDPLTNDGLTLWHPAFLQLGKTLDESAKKYHRFCQRYKPKLKTASKSYWGSKLLAGYKIHDGTG